MQASDGDSRFTAALGSLRKGLSSGPRWASSRVFTGSAAAAVALLAVTGVVALSTSGSTTTKAKNAAVTSTAKPHYLLPIGSLIKDGSVPPPSLNGDTGAVGVPKGTTARPSKPIATNPDSSTISTYRGGAGTMTPAGIATLALERGCSAGQAPIATAIAMAESGGSPSAQGDITLMTPVWDWSAGLWQIRGLRSERGTGGLRDSIANQRAVTNSAAMYVISSGCTNWTPWTTYTRGLYLGYLGLAQQAVNYVLSYYKAHGHYPPVAAPDPTAVIPVATGGGAVAPAVAPSSSAPAAKPTTTKRAGAPNQPAGTTAAPGGGQPAGGGGGGTSKTHTPTPSPTPTTSTPKLPGLPTSPTKLPLPGPSSKPKLPLPSLPVLGGGL